MPDLSVVSPGLFVFVLLLGLRHGLDADHLATIDGLARLQTARGRTGLARCSGLLFSSGHGLVVWMAAWGMHRYGASGLPEWLAAAGSLISVVLLLALATANLGIALGGVASGGSHWSARLPLPPGPAGGLLVGALFALSVDTMALAGGFALAGARTGMLTTLWLTMTFVAGMVLSDGLNGLLVARWIRRSDAFAAQARRLFALVLAASALLAAALGLAKLLSPSVDAWADGKELVFGCLVLGATAAGFVASARHGRRLASLSGSLH